MAGDKEPEKKVEAGGGPGPGESPDFHDVIMTKPLPAGKELLKPPTQPAEHEGIKPPTGKDDALAAGQMNDGAAIQGDQTIKQSDTTAVNDTGVGNPPKEIAVNGDKELSAIRPDAAACEANMALLKTRVAGDPEGIKLWNDMLRECAAHFKTPEIAKMAEIYKH